MKILTIILFLTLPFTLFAQEKIVGHYRDYFGSRIQLNVDSTFKHTWNFDMATSWIKGAWRLVDDTVYLEMVPTYDTISKINASGSLSDTLILSSDETPERLTETHFISTLLSSGGQDRVHYPNKLLFRKGRLYKIRNGKLVIKKQKGFWTSKKWGPWFFKSDD